MFANKPVSQYTSARDGAWRLWFRSDHWNPELWSALRERLAAERQSRHPRTTEIRLAGAAQPLYLKAFYGTSAVGALKDFFRRSKAVRSLMLTERLAGLGFHVPIAIGAGEERYAKLLRRSFLVTIQVSGRPLPLFLREHLELPAGAVSLRQKRRALASLAEEIRRLHDHGFVHGDLVPGNIFVAPTTAGAPRCFFMDNDRTRQYPTWLPHRLWRRNLVQLNRFPLAGISLQDRMRFFHAYAGRRKLRAQDRKFVRWLEQKTRQRRRECEAVDVSGSFRRLMRWDAPGH
jgi:serine/threonine protein kinase